jgi:hypothetical protein
MATLRTLLMIAADEDLESRQIDFKTAFLVAISWTWDLKQW